MQYDLIRSAALARPSAIAAFFFAVCMIVGAHALPAQAPSHSAARTSAFDRYEARVTRTQNQQPHWITPLITVTPRLEQEFRTDFVHSISPSHTSTWIYDNSKGLELIPAPRTEILLNLPPFLSHSNGQKDGFGDISFLLKQRLYARNEQHGDSIATLFFGASIPTGKNVNGLCCAVVTPSIALGKGRGLWDLSSTLGGSLPISNAAALGHTLTWNTVLQYQTAHHGIGRLLWPELESNDIFYIGGPNTGKAVSYLTPGLVLGRIPLRPHDSTPAGQRLGLTLGAGEQIALTRFNTYNHALTFTARIPF